MYIYNLSKLLPGDILLERYPGDSTSDLICETSNCNYSHARLYVGNNSVIEAGATVEANNVARTLIDDPSTVCVLRLKPELFSENVILEAIMYVRRLVGTKYSRMEAYGVQIRKNKEAVEPNRQICTRLIAQAFREAGINLVENADYCTTNNIEESDILIKVDDILREASNEDIEFAKSTNVLNKQNTVQKVMFENINERLKSDVQTIEQITFYVIEHPSDASVIVDIMRESGYFDMWKWDEEMNPHLYNAELFCKHFKNNLMNQAKYQLDADEECRLRFKSVLIDLQMNALIHRDNVYFRAMRDLYKTLIGTCDKRDSVARKAIESTKIVE